jgi:hypothetical protein
VQHDGRQRRQKDVPGILLDQHRACRTDLGVGGEGAVSLRLSRGTGWQGGLRTQPEAGGGKTGSRGQGTCHAHHPAIPSPLLDPSPRTPSLTFCQTIIVIWRLLIRYSGALNRTMLRLRRTRGGQREGGL